MAIPDFLKPSDQLFPRRRLLLGHCHGSPLLACYSGPGWMWEEVEPMPRSQNLALWSSVAGSRCLPTGGGEGGTAWALWPCRAMPSQQPWQTPPDSRGSVPQANPFLRGNCYKDHFICSERVRDPHCRRGLPRATCRSWGKPMPEPAKVGLAGAPGSPGLWAHCHRSLKPLAGVSQQG